MRALVRIWGRILHLSSQTVDVEPDASEEQETCCNQAYQFQKTGSTERDRDQCSPYKLVFPAWPLVVVLTLVQSVIHVRVLPQVMDCQLQSNRLVVD